MSVAKGGRPAREAIQRDNIYKKSVVKMSERFSKLEANEWNKEKEK